MEVDKSNVKNFRKELFSSNKIEIIITIASNIMLVIITHAIIKDLEIEQLASIFSASLTLLSITGAVIIFYGDYVQRTTSWLFEKRDQLSKFEGSKQRMGKVMLKLIFLSYMLWWSFICASFSFFISFLSIYMVLFSGFFGVTSLALLLVAVVTIILWLSLFIFLNTPGRITYIALVGDPVLDNS